MTRQTYSDETLMAYADGELGPELVAEIDALIERDMNLAGRVAMFARTRIAVKQVFDERIDARVPDRLKESIESMVAARSQPVVSPEAAVHPVAANSNAPWWRDYRTAAAAAIVAVLAASGGYLAGGSGSSPSPALEVATAAPSRIAELLSTVPSGQKMRLPNFAGEIEIISTFSVGDNVCREFELAADAGRSSVAVACASNGEWTTLFAVVTNAGSQNHFVPASSMEAVEAYLASISAGAPLTDQEEALFLRRAR